MTTLRASPFSLSLQDLVAARIRVRNIRGWNTEGTENSTGQTIRTEPLKMAVGRRGSNTLQTQVEAEWDLPTSPNDGDSTILAYNLQMLESSTWTDIIGPDVATTVTSVIVTDSVVPGNTYNFRVRA